MKKAKGKRNKEKEGREKGKGEREKALCSMLKRRNSPLLSFPFYLLHFSFCLYFVGCGFYSFTGASIPENIQTIAIPQVVDNSVNTFPTLGDQMTELLVNRFVRQTRLSLVEDEDEADAVLTVELQRYTNAPSAVSGEERAALNRVSLTAAVVYIDRSGDDEKELLRRSFTSFEEYDPVNLDDEEVAAVAALQNLADDIFTAATSNW
jgi:Lipopolysaccharide-assembly